MRSWFFLEEGLSGRALEAVWRHFELGVAIDQASPRSAANRTRSRGLLHLAALSSNRQTTRLPALKGSEPCPQPDFVYSRPSWSLWVSCSLPPVKRPPRDSSRR